jgi:hypothetical protein
MNGGDNLLKFSFLYLIFADSYRYLSVNPSKNFDITTNIFNNLVGLSIQLHLCLAYFLSTVYKLNSSVWFHGTATYYTLSLERFQGSFINKLIANNGYLVTFSTFATLIIELSFPFLVWFKSTKNIVLSLTFLLHIGIFWMMMIYDFQIIFLLMHPFFYTNSELVKFCKPITSKIASYAK